MSTDMESVVKLTPVDNPQLAAVQALMQLSRGASKNDPGAPQKARGAPKKARGAPKMARATGVSDAKKVWEARFQELDRFSEAWKRASLHFPAGHAGRKDMREVLAVAFHEAHRRGYFSWFEVVEVGSDTPCCMGGILGFWIKPEMAEAFAEFFFHETCGYPIDWNRYRAGDPCMGLDGKARDDIEKFEQENPAAPKKRKGIEINWRALVSMLSSASSRYCLSPDAPDAQRVNRNRDAFMGKVAFRYRPAKLKAKPKTKS
jgi:hypothetical protein